MKKIMGGILTVSFLLTFVGCAGNNAPATQPQTDTVQQSESADTLDSSAASGASTTSDASMASDASAPPDLSPGSLKSTDSTESAVSSDSVAESPSASTPPTYIGEDAAKTYALEHAGLDETEMTFIKVRLDREDRRTVYDIEFIHNNNEYDYEIDAYTGVITSYDYDIDNHAISPDQNNEINQTQTEITLDEAKSIALTKANLSAEQVTYTETSFEYDDGISVYQIDFVAGDMEYEFEINATDGTIMEYDAESRFD